MDWSNPSKEDIEMLVTSMIEGFRDIYTLSNYLRAEKVDFELPNANFLQPRDEQFHTYVATAIREGFMGRLYEKLREVPRFDQSFFSLSFKKIADDYQLRHDRMKQGVCPPKPKAEAAVAEPILPSGKVDVAEPNWDELSGKQLKVLRHAIESAFPNPKDFDIFLSDTFNQRPLSTHSAAGGFPQQLFDFLQNVRAEGWAKELVTALEATKRVPLRNLIADLGKVTR